jgi:hypothetical protein
VPRLQQHKWNEHILSQTMMIQGRLLDWQESEWAIPSSVRMLTCPTLSLRTPKHCACTGDIAAG